MSEAYSNNTKLADILAVAPNLKDLTIGFDWYEPYCPAELNQVFESTTWPCLETVAMEHIDATSKNLKCFFEQHASILKHVIIEPMRREEGTWIETFGKITTVYRGCCRFDLCGFQVSEFPGEVLGAGPWRLALPPGLVDPF